MVTVLPLFAEMLLLLWFPSTNHICSCFHDSLSFYSVLTCWCSIDDPLLILYTVSNHTCSMASASICAIYSKLCISGPDLTLESVYPVSSPYLNFSYGPLPLFSISINTITVHVVASVKNLEIYSWLLFTTMSDLSKKQI